jgi:serine protease inhibitor
VVDTMGLLVRTLFLIVMTSLSSAAQEEFGQALPNLLRGNEQFGRKLLLLVDSSASDRNVVISPLSLTIIFAALQSDSEGGRGSTRTEIGDAFGWGDWPTLNIPARMLLVAFEAPEKVPLQSKRKSRADPFPGLQRPPEGSWVTNDLLYRGNDTLSARFVTDAQKYYRVNFKNTGTLRPAATDLKSAGSSGKVLPSISGKDDVLISSGSHLQTAWSGNTFSISVPRKTGFTTASGELRQVEVLDSEQTSYLYAKTDTFEAAVLPCNSAYMVAVLPAPGQSLHDLERLLAETPDSIDAALKKQLGTVTMPTFHFRFETNLRQPIEQMGIKKVFSDLGSLVKIPKSHLTEVSQKTDIQVDKQGIRASAESIIGGIYGGIGAGGNAFHMELNRPFVFLIRDRTTNALMFLGVVADPSKP